MKPVVNCYVGGNILVVNVLLCTASLAPRTKRPIRVAYRVGQVIRHKTLGYRGVIVGWDYEAQVGSTLYVNV